MVALNYSDVEGLSAADNFQVVSNKGREDLSSDLGDVANSDSLILYEMYQFLHALGSVFFLRNHHSLGLT